MILFNLKYTSIYQSEIIEYILQTEARITKHFTNVAKLVFSENISALNFHNCLLQFAALSYSGGKCGCLPVLHLTIKYL